MINNNTILIFDYDGTICDLIIDWKNWHIGLGEIYRKFVPDFDLHLKGQKIHEYLNPYSRKFGKDFHKLITNFNREYESKNLTGHRVHKKVVEFIKLHKNNEKYIWTSNSRLTIENQLKILQIENQFKSLITRDDVICMKPDPEGFSKIIDPTRSLSDYIFIGDSIFDEMAATEAGINFIHVSTIENEEYTVL